MPRFIDTALIAEVIADARARPRRRANRNFHAADDATAHRLLNAIEPESWLPPHRHLDPAKDETIVVLAGALGAVIFDDAGEVVAARRLAAGGDCCGVDIPHGTWHTVLALASGTVIFEAKAGPYRPLTAAEMAPWAPGEGGDATAIAAWQKRLRALFGA